MNYGKNLRNAMMVRGVSTDKLMADIDAPRAVISCYKTRRKHPKWYRAIDIADALDVSLDWMTDRDYHNTQPAEITPLSVLVQELMDLCEMTRKDVYSSVGMGAGTLNKIMNDDDVELSSVVKLADFFDVSLDFLAGRGPQKGITAEEIENAF